MQLQPQRPIEEPERRQRSGFHYYGAITTDGVDPLVVKAVDDQTPYVEVHIPNCFVYNSSTGLFNFVVLFMSNSYYFIKDEYSLWNYDGFFTPYVKRAVSGDVF